MIQNKIMDMEQNEISSKSILTNDGGLFMNYVIHIWRGEGRGREGKGRERERGLFRDSDM